MKTKSLFRKFAEYIARQAGLRVIDEDVLYSWIVTYGDSCQELYRSYDDGDKLKGEYYAGKRDGYLNCFSDVMDAQFEEPKVCFNQNPHSPKGPPPPAPPAPPAKK